MNAAARIVSSSLAVISALLVSACGSDPPAPKSASNASVASPTNVDSSQGKSASKRDDTNQSAVAIDDAIAKACGISADSAHFDFDSSHVKTDDDRTLVAVATCFASGPLKGRTLHLVGHADSRGDSEYNVVLGQARADAVARYVTSKGLSKAQTASTSRGAMDATGSDEAGWTRDRRVDLTLGR
jgi:peptidoglycan-associated lipoprotein